MAVQANILMLLTGFISLNLVFLLFTFIAKKAFKFRISAASIIASITLTWPTIVASMSIYPSSFSNHWIPALFMLGSLIIYFIWLYFFQPESIEVMLDKELLRRRLDELNKQEWDVKKEILTSKKSNTYESKKDDLSFKLRQIKGERKTAKLKYKKKFWISKILEIYRDRKIQALNKK